MVGFDTGLELYGRFGSVELDIVCYSMAWYGMVWHSMAWYGMVWRGVGEIVW